MNCRICWSCYSQLQKVENRDESYINSKTSEQSLRNVDWPDSALFPALHSKLLPRLQTPQEELPRDCVQPTNSPDDGVLGWGLSGALSQINKSVVLLFQDLSSLSLQQLSSSGFSLPSFPPIRRWSTSTSLLTSALFKDVWNRCFTPLGTTGPSYLSCSGQWRNVSLMISVFRFVLMKYVDRGLADDRFWFNGGLRLFKLLFWLSNIFFILTQQGILLSHLFYFKGNVYLKVFRLIWFLYFIYFIYLSII